MHSSVETSPVSSQQQQRKNSNAKRIVGKHSRTIDSPAYDASEEDNEGFTDDAASTVSVPVSHPQRKPHSKTPGRKHQLAAAILSDSDPSLDSPTYDGDIESTIPSAAHLRTSHHHHHNYNHSTSSVSTLNTPISPAFPHSTSTSHMATPLLEPTASSSNDSNASPSPAGPEKHVFISEPKREPSIPSVGTKNSFSPASLTPEDIRAFVQVAIDGESWRKYKINQPPTDRPVRVYADGVYDLFHFGHALQLRQAKLSFPDVYLLVGVCSDEEVRQHKAQGIMTHAERIESVRHCRWVDQVVPDAPWVIDEAFMKKYNIDYVAHDEDPYVSGGHDDVYAYVKSQGKFIPTRRTPGISTSEMLERIVVGYRQCEFDAKLIKMGHEELRAEGSEYDDSRRPSRIPSRNLSPVPLSQGDSPKKG